MLIKLSGPDAGKFLNGQITSDINHLVINTPQLTALCNNKGRVIASFNIYKKINNNNYYYLLQPDNNIINLLITVLKKYGQFSDINITTVQSDSENVITPDLLYNIKHKIAHIHLDNSGLYLPHDLNYHHIKNIIIFTKGCYTGQEIIARMEYRGKLKKIIHYKLLTQAEFEYYYQNKKIINYIKINNNNNNNNHYYYESLGFF